MFSWQIVTGLLDRALGKGRESEVVNIYGWKWSKCNVFKPSRCHVSCLLVIPRGSGYGTEQELPPSAFPEL